MKPLLTLLTALLLAATAQGQTLKSLMVDTNNTVANTNRVGFGLLGVGGGTASIPSLTYASGTNVFGTFAGTQFGIGPFLGFSVDGTRRFYISTNTIHAELPLSFATNVVAESRTNLGLGATWLTNDNVTNFRSAIGLGATNEVQFDGILLRDNSEIKSESDGSGNLVIDADEIMFNGRLDFQNPTAAATTRTNLGLGLPALTNDSNVTMMRALAGSTNTNEPFSGTINFQDLDDIAHVVSISNGIILNWTATAP